MSQVSQYTVADGSGLSVRGAINAILEALASSNSGTSAPANPVVGQWWCNTSVSPRALNVYDDVSASWITIAYLEANGLWAVIEPQADLRYLKLSGGTLTGPVTGTSASFTGLTVNGVSVGDASILTSGLVATARLGSGTANSGVFLRGDQTWSQVLGSQVSGAVQEANSVASNGGYATFNWSGQSGQPSWVWGSNDGLNFLVWNPSSFNVNELQGFVPSTSSSPSTIALRDGGGYLWAQYFNQGSGQNENPSISQVAVSNGADGFWRKAGLAYFLEQAMLSGAVTLQADPGGTPANGTPGSIVWYY